MKAEETRSLEGSTNFSHNIKSPEESVEATNGQTSSLKGQGMVAESNQISADDTSQLDQSMVAENSQDASTSQIDESMEADSGQTSTSNDQNIAAGETPSCWKSSPKYKINMTELKAGGG